MKKIGLFVSLLSLLCGVSFAQKFPKINVQSARAASFAESQEQTFDKQVLVLVAHPNLKESTANKALAEVARNVDGVEVVDLYALKSFNVDYFKNMVEKVDAVVFQFPFYYASAPARMKEWIDDVFYMFPRDMVKGKALLVVTTTGSEESAYCAEGRNKFTVPELLRPYELTANHSGMVWQTPLVVYGMSTDDASKNLSAGEKKYRQVLTDLAKSMKKSLTPTVAGDRKNASLKFPAGQVQAKEASAEKVKQVQKVMEKKK